MQTDDRAYDCVEGWDRRASDAVGPYGEGLKGEECIPAVRQGEPCSLVAKGRVLLVTV
ncbi:MAG: hypothetical protein ACI87A_002909 [Planctomycetota bacterium]|jgi:hypothetical protein